MLSWILKLTLGLGALSLLVACGAHLVNSGKSVIEPAPAQSHRVASLNVHYIIAFRETGAWSVGDWERRRAPLTEAVKAMGADILALQESETFPDTNEGGANLVLDHLLSALPDYAAAAHGPADTFPPSQPILYKPSRYEMRDQGWFFFSDTPDQIYSRTFNGSWPAFASWAEFEPRNGDPAFRVVNVHFEYSSRSNRRLSAALVRDRIAPWIAQGIPVLLVGDLNAMHGSATMSLLEEADLTFLHPRGSTYHLNRGINLFGAIDHLGHSHAVQAVSDPVIVRQKFDDEWPSDHYPVFADFELLP